MKKTSFAFTLTEGQPTHKPLFLQYFHRLKVQIFLSESRTCISHADLRNLTAALRTSR